MGMYIKNERTDGLVRELAALRGVSLVAAVTEAVEEKLAREKAAQKHDSSGKSRLERIIEISERTAPLMNDGRTTKELFDELYDEYGLPK
ncbi:MAG TPA: type II toxin-antitoxin system VapB family antitoxin [Terracidiphilus sp.]|nr:type II toxin-antitoxin system VapB family antitoxin [Terracidiphilus sp.]